MTANASLVSAKNPQPVSPASAVQARASSQSAAIALLGAGISSANHDDSFAGSLESESKRQAAAQGLFSDKSAGARPDPRADRPTSDSSRHTGVREPKPAPSSDDVRTGPLSGRPQDQRSGPLGHAEPDSDSSLISSDVSFIPGTAATIDANPVGAITNPLAQNPQSAANPSVSESAAEPQQNGENSPKSQRPTDPLRLIVPPQTTASGQAPTAPETATAPTTPQSASISHADTKPISVRKHSGASTQVGASSGTPVHSTMPSGAATTPTVSGPSAAPQSGAVTGASAANGGSLVAGFDQITPTRHGNGRVTEQPVTLKFKLAPQTNNAAQQLNETEVAAAETQIARGLTAAFRQNTPQVTLWMSPETLGKVRIQLTFDQGTISARFEATCEATKDLLAQNMSALRDALQSRGLTANQIDVATIPDWSQQSGPQSGNGEGRGTSQQSPNQSASDGNSPFGQGGQRQQGAPEHSKGWSALPQGNGANKPDGSAQAQISLTVDSRLMMLNAQLELDAVA